MKDFWVGFEKRAADGTTGYQESSDPLLNTFFIPQKSGVWPTQAFGVKINNQPGEDDIAQNVPLISGNAAEIDMISGRY